MTITESPVAPTPHGSHRLTTAKAMVEAIELRRWSATRRSSTSARTSARTAASSARPPACRRGSAPTRVIDTPISETRVHRPGHRCRGRGDAADRRADVRRLHGRVPGPDLQPHGQDPLRVRRPREGADGAHDGRRRRVLRRGAALAVPVGHVRAPARDEGRRAQQPVRRQGPDDVGHPRRQPGRLHVPQGRHGAAVDGEEPALDRRRAGGALHRADRQGHRGAPGHRRRPS